MSFIFRLLTDFIKHYICLRQTSSYILFYLFFSKLDVLKNDNLHPKASRLLDTHTVIVQIEQSRHLSTVKQHTSDSQSTFRLS